MQERVLLIGATGRLGQHFVKALQSGGHSVLALIRTDRATEDPQRRELLARYAHSGVRLLEGGLEDSAALERGMKEVDAVISCIDHRPDHLLLQAHIAKVAARFGHIARVMPSQFGIDSRLYGEARVEHGDVKRKMQGVFQEAGVPFTFVHTNGLANEWVGSLGQLGLPRPPTGGMADAFPTYSSSRSCTPIWVTAASVNISNAIWTRERSVAHLPVRPCVKAPPGRYTP